MQNFSTATAKKTIYDLLFLTVIYSPQNENKHPFEMKNEQHNSHFTITKVFPGLGPILATGLKYWLNVTFSKQTFAYKLSFEKNSLSSSQSSRSAHLQYE